MGIPLCDICYFSLAVFNICSLCLIFVNLINMCLGVFLLGFILFGTLWVSWTQVAISFPILGKFSAIIFSIFLMLFHFIFFWDTYDSKFGVFNSWHNFGQPIFFFHLTISSPIPMSISLFSMSVSPLLPCK